MPLDDLRQLGPGTVRPSRQGRGGGRVPEGTSVLPGGQSRQQTKQLLSDWFADSVEGPVGYMNIIEVPAGLTIAANHSAVYGLRCFTLPDDADLIAFNVNALPADSSPGVRPGAANPLAWGDVTGSTAWLVVLPDSSIVEGEWTGMELPLPGIEYGNAGSGAATRSSAGGSGLDFHFALPLPPGRFSDNPPSVLDRVYNLAPCVRRYARGQRCCIGLAMRRTYVASLGAAGQIVGRVMVRPRFVLSQSLQRRSD